MIDPSMGKYGMVGRSDSMAHVYTLVDRVTGNPASYSPTVMIHGERGTGKELVARAIHEYGPRKDHLFVAFNCAALTETLLESELFGHSRGAFTGAVRDKQGLFQEADGGTLFIDEIVDMPQPMQVKLLRALQERRIRPVGGEREIPYDAHIIVASSKSLKEAVTASRFRPDLYDRLNMVKIDLPPLRERGEDILLLSDYFIGKCQAQAEKGPFALAQEARVWVYGYAWPGNIRELENTIYGIIALKKKGDRELRADDFETHSSARLSDQIVSLAEIERRAILQAVALCHSRGEAARRLGISERTLYNKLKGYGVQ